MDKLKAPGAEIYVPDGKDADTAAARSTIMVFGAHQDDIEMIALHGILEGLNAGGYKLFGVVATDGVSSLHSGDYSGLSFGEIRETRNEEQREASRLGKYSAVALLNYTSPEVKDKSVVSLDDDLLTLIEAVKPEKVYMHNPFDRHDTHVAMCIRTLESLRRAAAKGIVPKHVFGCEVWRGLDWLIHCDRAHLAVVDTDNIGDQLIRVFRSQFAGNRHYDLAAKGRRIANATYHESHNIEMDEEMTFAVDLLPLVQDATLNLSDYARHVINRFESDVMARLERYHNV